MTGASILTTVLPIAIGGAVITKTVQQTMGGKPGGGSRHYHYKGKKAISHKHEGGHISHTHRGLQGYGRTRKSLRR